MFEVPEISRGKILFRHNCKACHWLHGTDEFLLEKIADNKYDTKLMYAFIRNSDSIINSGNVYMKVCLMNSIRSE